MTDAARHYFDDLATQNDAVSSTFDGLVPTGEDMHSLVLDCVSQQTLLCLANDGGCANSQMALPVRVCHTRRTQQWQSARRKSPRADKQPMHQITFRSLSCAWAWRIHHACVSRFLHYWVCRLVQWHEAHVHLRLVSAPAALQILVGVIRLPEHGSDVVLSLNTPLFISERRCGVASMLSHVISIVTCQPLHEGALDG